MVCFARKVWCIADVSSVGTLSDTTLVITCQLIDFHLPIYVSLWIGRRQRSVYP